MARSAQSTRKRLHVVLEEAFIDLIDAKANQERLTRSEFIRRAIMDRLRGADTMPPRTGINMLMTDEEMENLRDWMRFEQIRRRRRNR